MTNSNVSIEASEFDREWDAAMDELFLCGHWVGGRQWVRERTMEEALATIVLPVYPVGVVEYPQDF